MRIYNYHNYLLKYPYSKSDLINCFKYFHLKIDEDKIKIKKRETDKNFIGYILPRSSSIDIDTLDDWNFAEIIYKGINR